MFMLYSRYLTYLGSNKEGFIRMEVLNSNIKIIYYKKKKKITREFLLDRKNI